MLTRRDVGGARPLRRAWRRVSRSTGGSLILAVGVVLSTALAWNLLSGSYGIDVALGVLFAAYVFYAIAFVAPSSRRLLDWFHKS